MPAPQVGTGVYSSSHHNALAAYVDDTRTGFVARGRRETSSPTTTGELGVLRLDDIPILAGHIYEISTSTLTMIGSVAGSECGCKLRYTTDGSTPTTASAQLPGSTIRQTIPASGVVALGSIVTRYTPVVDETLSVLLTVVHVSGAGNNNLSGSATDVMDLVVTVLGVDPGDTGVDI
jgi:hypothetical protein